MKPHSRKWYTLLASVLLVVGGLSLACLLWMKREQRQYAMNRELIDSLRQGDFNRSLKLVEAGADPNTHVIPMPAPKWQELWTKLLPRSIPSSNNSLTAFMAVCGDPQVRRVGIQYLPIPENRRHDPQIMPLAQVMLFHGANINATDQLSDTALMVASGVGANDWVTFLLEHGALMDLQDDDGNTALHLATEGDNIEAVKLLLKYHANLNVRNKDGYTPLRLAVWQDTNSQIIRLLK